MGIATAIVYQEKQIADRALIASTFFERLFGLLGRKPLKSGDALIIPQCSMVHMFFMRFPIDVIFCNKDQKILAICENLKPWRISRYVPGSYYAVELAEGSLRELKLTVGDKLSW